MFDSDVVHKKMHGVDPKSPLPDTAYTKENIQTFIKHIHSEAERNLRAGKSVIVSGTFLDTVTRHNQEDLARRNGGDFIGIYLHASASVLFERVSKRKDSVSDADKKVLKRQITLNQPKSFRELNWHLINADQAMESIVDTALFHIRQRELRNRVAANTPKTPKKQGNKPKP
ncbi:MAG TPA: AAA family ATPase [Patescibacteria group bacterium]|nr:AAA family ATPase [Patescibacteria group bacterium]